MEESNARTGHGESDLRKLRKFYYKVEKRNGRVVDEAVMLMRKFCFIQS